MVMVVATRADGCVLDFWILNAAACCLSDGRIRVHVGKWLFNSDTLLTASSMLVQ